jgi:uncharacterized protein YdcH (DUF465 family)
MTSEDEIRNFLVSNDPDFRRMVEEHHSYEQQLRALTEGHATPQAQFEEINLKKRKLFLKDQMSRRIQEYRHAQAGR